MIKTMKNVKGIWTRLFQNWAEGGGCDTLKNEEVIPNIFSNQVSLGVSYARWTRCEHSQVLKTHCSGSTGLKKLNLFENHAKLSPLETPSEVGINSKKWAHHSVCARKKWGTYRQTMKLLSTHAHDHIESFTYPQHDLTTSRSRPRSV